MVYQLNEIKKKKKKYIYAHKKINKYRRTDIKNVFV